MSTSGEPDTLTPPKRFHSPLQQMDGDADFSVAELLRFIENFQFVCHYKGVDAVGGLTVDGFCQMLRTRLINYGEPVYRVFYVLIMNALAHNITLAEIATDDAQDFQMRLVAVFDAPVDHH